MKSSFFSFIGILNMVFIFSCSKIENGNKLSNITVTSSSFIISGEAQSGSFEIVGNSSWEIMSTDWIKVSENIGEGNKTIIFYAEENLYEPRQGFITIISSNNQYTFIEVTQSPVFIINTRDELVRTFYGYNDKYELYAKTIHADIASDIKDDHYKDMISNLIHEYSQKKFRIELFADGYVFLIPDFSLYINNKLCFSDLAIYINQSFMEEKDIKNLSYYQDLDRADIIKMLKSSILEHCMLASWPGATTIRFELAMACDNRLRFYIGDSTNYDIQPGVNYSLLNFTPSNSIPNIGSSEYSIIKDRFEGREFKDDDGNVYSFSINPKKLKDVSLIDISLEQKTCPYNFNLNSTYPFVSITKNGDIFYELMAFMYVEWLGTSLNTGDEAYCTGFESELAINGEVIRIDFDSGVDDDNNAWFQLQKNRVFDYYDNEFHDYESQVIKLQPIDNDRTPLAGVNIKQ